MGFAIASAADPIVIPRAVGGLAILAVFLACLGVVLCAAVFHPRIGAVVGAWWLLAAFILVPNDHTIRTRPAVAETVGVEQALRQWLSQRRDLDAYRQARIAYPVIFVSSEGGGIYAAAHAHAVLSTLAARCPTFSQHVLVAVGVSGGAVGNALFHAAADPAQKPAAPCAPGNTRLDQTALSADHLSPVLARMLLLETLDSFLPGQWISRDRGGVLVDSFRESTANGRSLDTLVGQSFDPASARPAVAAVTTNMATGGRLVLSPIVADSSSAEWFPQMLPGARDVDILEAAGMSARFPWVTPTAQLQVANDSARILADGGYFENSGADTVLDLIHALRMAEAWELNDEKQENEPAEPVCRIHVARNIHAPADWKGCEIHIFPIHLAITTTGIQSEDGPPHAVTQSFLLDPLMTLISTRSARGRLALLRAQEDQCGTSGAVCVENPDATSGFFMSQISPVELGLPLGWFIRQREASAIASGAIPSDVFGYRATSEAVGSDLGHFILHLDHALWMPGAKPDIYDYRGQP